MIIGLTGTLGAGKGETAKILIQSGYVYHSCSDVLREELKKRGIEENIENLSKLGNEIRENFGAGELPRRLTAIIRKNGEKKAIVDSLRSVGEIQELRKEHDFILIAVEAPIELRYERVKKRGRKGDDLSFEEFQKQEQAQMSGKGVKQNLKKCIEMADYRVSNEGNLEELKENIEAVLREIE